MRVEPLGWVMRMPSVVPSARIVNVTPIVELNPSFACWDQIIQIRCWTLARYQSPPLEVPSSRPMPGGAFGEIPMLSAPVPVPPGPVTAGRAEAFDLLVLVPEAGGGGVAFFLLCFESSSGSASRGISSFGGLMICWGAWGGSGAWVCGGTVDVGAAGAG